MHTPRNSFSVTTVTLRHRARVEHGDIYAAAVAVDSFVYCWPKILRASPSFVGNSDGTAFKSGQTSLRTRQWAVQAVSTTLHVVQFPLTSNCQQRVQMVLRCLNCTCTLPLSCHILLYKTPTCAFKTPCLQAVQIVQSVCTDSTRATKYCFTNLTAVFPSSA